MDNIQKLVLVGLLLLVAVRANAEQDAVSARNTVSILEYGATPDGRSDSTAAIKEAIAVAKMRHVEVFIPPGTYRHRSFSLNGVSMAGVGPSSILIAPSPEDSNIYVRGFGVSLRNLSLVVNSSHRDASNFAVYIQHADGFVIQDVTVTGGNAGGIFDFGGRNGRIIHNRIQNTLADAIHNTNGAHNIVVADNIVRHAGDDMVAVVSYSNEELCHDILIKNNDLAEGLGRGVAVVGGRDITIEGNKINETSCCAGIYLASESSYRTGGVHNILVRDNVLSNNSGVTGHGAIMLFADYGAVGNVKLEANTVANAKHSAVTLLGKVSNIALNGNRLIDPAEGGLTGSGTNVSCRENTLNGSPFSPSACDVPHNLPPIVGAKLDLLSEP